MSHANNEQLSALMDDEFDGDVNLVDHLLQESHLQSAWSRYHLIGDCLRSHLAQTVINDVVPIAQASQAAPIISQPNQHKSVKNTMMKPALGFAIAASVAMLAILTVQTGTETTTAPADVVAFNKTNTLPPQTVGLHEATKSPVAVHELNSVANKRLNHYLVNHNEYRSHGSVSGIMPYVRIVAIERQEQ